MDGRWGTEYCVPVRLASVMAHLGSYEEILAHVFHTSVLSSTAPPGKFFTNKTCISGAIVTRETKGNREARIFQKFNIRTRLLNNVDSRSLRTAIQSLQSVSHTLQCVHNEVAKAALNKALMNLSGSRLGREADRTGCRDCQLSTWDS